MLAQINSYKLSVKAWMFLMSIFVRSLEAMNIDKQNICNGDGLWGSNNGGGLEQDTSRRISRDGAIGWILRYEQQFNNKVRSVQRYKINDS